jgi:hypothetical protein
MIPHDVYYQLAVVGFLWLCIMLHYVWPSQNTVLPPLPTAPLPPGAKRKRTSETFCAQFIAVCSASILAVERRIGPLFTSPAGMKIGALPKAHTSSNSPTSVNYKV